jgi:hypothetical protein
MNKYLHNRLINYITPKEVNKMDYSIPYDGYGPGVLSPKEIEEAAMSLNFEK